VVDDAASMIHLAMDPTSSERGGMSVSASLDIAAQVEFESKT